MAGRLRCSATSTRRTCSQPSTSSQSVQLTLASSMRRSSGLAGLGSDHAEGRGTPEFGGTTTFESTSARAGGDGRASLGNGLARSSSQQSHLRQQSLTSACLPASSPDLTKRSIGSRVFRMFDSEQQNGVGPDGNRSAAGSSSSSALPSSRRSNKPLPVRLLQLAYLTFALVYTTASVFGLAGHNYAAESAIARQAAQQLPLSAMGDAWQAMRDRIPFQTATAVAEEPAATPTGADGVSGAQAEKASAFQAAAKVDAPSLQQASRLWQAEGAHNNPLSLMDHPYRFSKIHPKLATSTHDQITPFAFRATQAPASEDITACYYTNDAWLELLPEFASRWNGPISLVVETLSSRDSASRQKLLKRLSDIREAHDVLKMSTDVHIVTSTTPNMTQLLTHPVAANAHANLARFFARTDNVFNLPDARLMPSVGLRRRLGSDTVSALLQAGDAVVVPTFAPLRIIEGEGSIPTAPSLTEAQDLGQESSQSQIAEYIHQHLDTLALPMPEWPTRKAPLVGMASTKPPESVMSGRPAPDGPIFGLFDRTWDLNKGPSNFALWRRTAMDPQLEVAGAGLGVDGDVGGGHSVYRVDNYELHYAPLLVHSREGHPWCNERFDRNQAACDYAAWLTGAEFWVLPDEWVFTLEAVETPEPALTPAERLRDSIESRLYTKYHAEACMHYGREFLSKGMWEKERAKHLRAICGKVLGSWGMGILQGGSE